MQTVPFGQTGMMVTRLGFGGSEVGYGSGTPEEVSRLLNAVLDSGVNVLDTAECYMDGEEKYGRAVSHRRDEFHLFTKCGHASGLPFADWTPELLAASLERSLCRLQTDRVDLWQLHSCPVEVLKDDRVVSAMVDAKKAGKTRFIGYSGDSDAALFALGLDVFDALQTSCNIADQESIDRVLPVARAKGLGLVAKRPIANAAWRAEAAHGYASDYHDRLKALDYGFDDPASKALRFTLAQQVDVLIVGTLKAERIAENVATANMGPLPPHEVAVIRSRWAEVAGKDWRGRT